MTLLGDRMVYDIRDSHEKPVVAAGITKEPIVGTG